MNSLPGARQTWWTPKVQPGSSWRRVCRRESTELWRRRGGWRWPGGSQRVKAGRGSSSTGTSSPSAVCKTCGSVPCASRCPRSRWRTGWTTGRAAAGPCCPWWRSRRRKRNHSWENWRRTSRIWRKEWRTTNFLFLRSDLNRLFEEVDEVEFDVTVDEESLSQSSGWLWQHPLLFSNFLWITWWWWWWWWSEHNHPLQVCFAAFNGVAGECLPWDVACCRWWCFPSLDDDDGAVHRPQQWQQHPESAVPQQARPQPE